MRLAQVAGMRLPSLVADSPEDWMASPHPTHSGMPADDRSPSKHPLVWHAATGDGGPFYSEKISALLSRKVCEIEACLQWARDGFARCEEHTVSFGFEPIRQWTPADMHSRLNWPDKQGWWSVDGEALCFFAREVVAKKFAIITMMGDSLERLLNGSQEQLVAFFQEQRDEVAFGLGISPECLTFSIVRTKRKSPATRR